MASKQGFLQNLEKCRWEILLGNRKRERRKLSLSSCSVPRREQKEDAKRKLSAENASAEKAGEKVGQPRWMASSSPLSPSALKRNAQLVQGLASSASNSGRIRSGAKPPKGWKLRRGENSGGVKTPEGWKVRRGGSSGLPKVIAVAPNKYEFRACIGPLAKFSASLFARARSREKTERPFMCSRDSLGLILPVSSGAPGNFLQLSLLCSRGSSLIAGRVLFRLSIRPEH